MPLVEPGGTYAALVAIPACNAAETIEATLESAAASVRADRQRRDVVLSVVDDASTDRTAALVRAFADATDVDVILTVNAANAGRAVSRNRAVAAADADMLFFLDHDDTYLPRHIALCLDALAAERRSDFVKTGIALTDPVHPDWHPRIAGSLTQNLCVRSYCHRLIGGFVEAREVEVYGCDDVLYNDALRRFFRGVHVPDRTAVFHRRPGNSFDRQYDRKFARPPAAAEVTLRPDQRAVEEAVRELQKRRLREIAQRRQWMGLFAQMSSSRRPSK
ncbi:MAG: glycosyltransferase family 2 protein [Pseudomonadota bacterium]